MRIPSSDTPGAEKRPRAAQPFPEHTLTLSLNTFSDNTLLKNHENPCCNSARSVHLLHRPYENVESLTPFQKTDAHRIRPRMYADGRSDLDLFPLCDMVSAFL